MNEECADLRRVRRRDRARRHRDRRAHRCRTACGAGSSRRSRRCRPPASMHEVAAIANELRVHAERAAQRAFDLRGGVVVPAELARRMAISASSAGMSAKVARRSVNSARHALSNYPPAGRTRRRTRRSSRRTARRADSARTAGAASPGDGGLREVAFPDECAPGGADLARPCP